MLPFQFSDSHSVVVLGLAVVAAVFVLRRTLLRTGSARPTRRARRIDDADQADKGSLVVAEMLEVRLHDFAREIEGRIGTRIAVLDRLIIDADREILRLQNLLAESRSQFSSVGRTNGGATSARHPDAVVAAPEARSDERKEAA